MRSLRDAAAWACLVVAPACASLSPAGANVRRAETRASVASCAFLGDVSVRPSVGSEGDDIVRLRNAAAELGANAIWVDSTVVAPGGRLYAAAFGCPQGQARNP
jgi:hypothetical protein